jgi:hypothetical protein
MASQGRTGLPDKIPIIIHDQDERETHYIFAKRPEPSEGPYTVLIAFNTKQGVPSKHRILIEHHTIIRDITVRGRFVIQNDTSDYEKDPSKVSKYFMKESLHKQLEDHGRPRKTRNFQPGKSRLSSHQAGGGKFKLSTRKVT